MTGRLSRIEAAQGVDGQWGRMTQGALQAKRFPSQLEGGGEGSGEGRERGMVKGGASK